MKGIHKRLIERSVGLLPPEGTEEYFEWIEELQKREEKNPKVKEFIKNNWAKIFKSLEAQSLSTCHFITEDTLRGYLNEFNGRAWQHGLRSMPVMFNIMEIFFKYRIPEMYFELFEEENYSISFFDFIDFITSDQFTSDRKLIDETITSELIYNFNVGKDLEEIKFKSDSDTNEYIVAGVSLIKRDNEIVVLLIAGIQEEERKELGEYDFNFNSASPNKVKMIEEFKRKNADTKYEYIFIDEKERYRKVLIGARFDIETLTIDARYIAEETTLGFDLVTDEIDGFLNPYGKFLTEKGEELFKSNLAEVEKYSDLFEAAKFSIYLPYYFSSHENDIIEETLDTDLKAKITNPITKKKYNETIGYKTALKPLYLLDTKKLFSPDVIKTRDDLFKVKTDGYWKNLAADEIGMDKKGNPVHGRTWVTQTLSWLEAKECELTIKKEKQMFDDPNAGYIYVLRNPSFAKDVYKIGYTTKIVEKRAEQLSNTSVPDRFAIVQEWRAKDCIRGEKEIHAQLSCYRIDERREFFQIEFGKAAQVISNIITEINQ